MLNITSTKQLSLTATIKEYDDENEQTVANNNVDYFGYIIDNKSLLWAINEKIVCDYEIQTLLFDETKLNVLFNQFKITVDNDKRLFLSAYATLKSIYTNQIHHGLLYTNNKENSIKIIEYTKILLK
jgi:hypothetical protein